MSAFGTDAHRLILAEVGPGIRNRRRVRIWQPGCWCHYRVFGESNFWWETLCSVSPIVTTVTTVVKWCPETMANAAAFETKYVFSSRLLLETNLGILPAPSKRRGDLQPDNMNEISAVDTPSANVSSSPAVVSVPPPAFHRG